MTILVFAGTSNGRILVNKLLEKDLSLVVSSASEYGASLLPSNSRLTSTAGKKDSKDIERLIDKYSIDLIIDCTHPYAIEVSNNIFKASNLTGIDVIRYERELVIPSYIGNRFNTIVELCNYLKNKRGNILFTTGVKDIPKIVSIVDNRRVFVRVLPVDSSIKIISDAGLSLEQVVTDKPPFSLSDNIKHIHEFNIKYLVTKDSGNEGNIAEKLEAADKKGIELLVLNRPKKPIKSVFYIIEEIMAYIDSFGGISG